MVEREALCPAPPRWFSPLRLLCIFCGVNLFVYLDRGLIASNGVNGSPPSETEPDGTGIQGAFHLTYFQDGLLPAAFMVGLLISSPIFAEASKSANPFRLLAIGMGLWTLACFGCAASPNFSLMLLCRALVGVGEASFVSLAAPFIDDYAPPKAKSRWFACFYLCTPVGFALGYIVGGIVAEQASWRWAFVIEAAPMIVFVGFALTVQPMWLKGSAGEDRNAGATKGVVSALRAFWADTRRVLSLRVWVFLCMAFTLYVAVFGVYAYWGPQAGRALFFGAADAASAGQADLAFGGVTVLTGVLGTLSGGILLDRVGSSLRNANLVCCGSNLVGVVLVLIAFTSTHSFAAFMVMFGLGEFVLFLMQAPVAAIGMWCVPPALRPLGVSLLTVSIHLFGDVPSPPLLGLLQTKLSEGMSPEDAAQQWRVSMSLISLLLVAAGLLFGYAAYISTPAADFRLQGTPEGPKGGQGGLREDPDGSTANLLSSSNGLEEDGEEASNAGRGDEEAGVSVQGGGQATPLLSGQT